LKGEGKFTENLRRPMGYIQFGVTFNKQTCSPLEYKKKKGKFVSLQSMKSYEGWNFNSGNYLFTTDTK